MATTYASLASLSGPTFQVRAFYKANTGWYDLEYIAEAVPGTLSTDNKWRICRVRYLTGTNNLYDKSYAINNISTNSKMASYNKATAEFLFQATDQATIESYTYGDQISSGMQLNSFSILKSNNSGLWVDCIGIIDETNKTVAITVPTGQDVTALKASFTTTLGASVKIWATAQTSGSTANNFTSPVAYIITDGIDSTTYTVTVNVDFGILTYNFVDDLNSAFEWGDITWVIDQIERTITLEVPAGTNVSALIGSFTATDDTTLAVGATAQVTGVTANNFTEPVTIIATKSAATHEYVVTVTIAA